ncbi:hypothetical protein TrVE_jg8201 [Triparma verrucosa]|uniref:Uncharacterized protein n=2 Tax=Triparma TaxID=722752 RepID=A0A9W7F0K9_9STRA|nr:hypothetical protein TrST_g13601 [Triparma strigata]GMI05041.1 hypothetical protein TrVE_jg8201 [Triparma verrucosa]
MSSLPLSYSQSLLSKLGWGLLLLSLLHSVSSSRAFPSTNPPLAVWLLLPLPVKLSTNYYSSILLFTLLTLLFDLTYLILHSSSLSSSPNFGTKFSFVIYVLAFLYKFFLAGVIGKAHVKLNDDIEVRITIDLEKIAVHS